ncbi:MAG: hypothetical protein COA79_00085 [Planctomycetota bacterium]|nr:MAG: hypothetical protein COA79_00085 [Planctomycetota bacterium]
MPCKDISELHRLILDENDVLVNYEAIKNTCGSKIEDKKELKKYLKHDILTILEKPFSVASSFFERKYLISIHSCIGIFLGLDPIYNGLNAELIGIEYDHGNIEAIIKIGLEMPVQDITPCSNSCGSCGTKSKK